MKALISVTLLLLSGRTPWASRQAQSNSTQRSRAVVEAIHRSGAIPLCWNAYVRAVPEAPSTRFRLEVRVSAAGRVVGVELLDPAPEVLARCIRDQVGRVAVPSGRAATVQTTYSFTAGEPAPVPRPR